MFNTYGDISSLKVWLCFKLCFNLNREMIEWESIKNRCPWSLDNDCQVPTLVHSHPRLTVWSGLDWYHSKIYIHSLHIFWNQCRRLVASSIIGGGGIFIYSCSQTIKTNRFQKKLITQNTNIWIWAAAPPPPPPPNYRACYGTVECPVSKPVRGFI